MGHNDANSVHRSYSEELFEYVHELGYCITNGFGSGEASATTTADGHTEPNRFSARDCGVWQISHFSMSSSSQVLANPSARLDPFTLSTFWVSSGARSRAHEGPCIHVKQMLVPECQ